MAQKPKKNPTKVAIYASEAVKKWLETRADKEHRSVSSLILLLIEREMGVRQ